VTDGETGLLVPARDPAALAAALERLLDSPALRRALRQKARAFVEESFDVRRNAWEVAIELTSMLAPRATTITGFETIQERAS
jgi:glycosyltransferase involved in cell wall biosynthesis